MTVQQTGTVLLQFSADWCGICRAMESTIVEFQKKSSAVYQNVNVDTEANLAKQYGVWSIPCFVVLKDGIQVARQVGTQSVAQLLELVK